MSKKQIGEDFLLLKWGTLKGWCLENSPEAMKAMDEYVEIGASMSAMMQKDTPRQKELICIMIDEVNGPVSSGWTGEDWSDNREAAKKYVMEYPHTGG